MYAIALLVLFAITGAVTIAKSINGVVWRLTCRLFPGFWHRDRRSRVVYRVLFHWRPRKQCML